MQSRHALAKDVLLAEQYRINTVLGSGGFGITYMAQDVGLGSAVVLKEYFPAQIAVRDQTSTVHPNSDRAQEIYLWGRDRFVREARILDSCRHPNIVRVRRVFETNNTAYMALDFEDGPNLEGWLKTLGRAPSQGEMDAIVWPLLDALAYLHDLPQPVIHRDIAPDNIIMREGKHPVLIDFGAARVEAAGRAESRVGAVKDGYSPREQYSQRAELQGPWTDIYAMAATLRRALTGERPPDSMGRDLDDQMQPIAQLGLQGYRPQFLAAIDAAMSVQHRARPQTVAAWRTMLFDGLDETPALAQSVLRSRPRAAPASGLRGDGAATPATSPPSTSRSSSHATDEIFAQAPPPARGGNAGPRALLLSLAAVLFVGAGLGAAQYVRRPAVGTPKTPIVEQATVRDPAPAASQPSPQPASPPQAAPNANPSPPPQVAQPTALELSQECERLAQPPSKDSVGVAFEDLNAAAALTVCDAAARAFANDARLEMLLGRVLAKTVNFGAAKQWFERASAKGDAYATSHLGIFYSDALGVRRDYAKARELFERAAAKDEPQAMNALGVLYENGRGVTQDHAKAREWYEKAVGLGNAAAINNLGNLYNAGRGVTPDLTRAASLYEQGAARNYGPSLHNLGLLYETGKGVTVDHAKALDLYQRGAARGHAFSMNNLGVFYERGRGVTVDLVKAREWYEKAAELNNARAMYHLGVLFANGRGVTADDPTARGWYEKSVERGDIFGMYNLALFLDQGRGGDKDFSRAAKLLLQAARLATPTLTSQANATLAGTMARWSPETVRALQTQLQSSSIYKGAINGTWDAASQAAAKQFAETRTN